MRTKGAGSTLPQGPVVKVCGLRREEDALLAAQLGAWALGFIFAPSPRQLAPERAAEIVGHVRLRLPSSRRPLAVGVFADLPAEEVADVAARVGLDAVQLHDEEPVAEVAALRAATQNRLLLIKTLGVGEGEAAGDLAARTAVYAAAADAFLLDTKVRGATGGTGVTFDWALAGATSFSRPVLVAGGIGPGNVAQALAVSRAWGVDVSSGLESAPGCKDENLLRELFAAVNNYKAGLSRQQAAVGCNKAAVGRYNEEGTS